MTNVVTTFTLMIQLMYWIYLMSFMYVIHQPWPAWSAESVPINLLSDALGPFEARHRDCAMSELVQMRALSTLPFSSML